jgi:hypothetical protein
MVYKSSPHDHIIWVSRFRSSGEQNLDVSVHLKIDGQMDGYLFMYIER